MSICIRLWKSRLSDDMFEEEFRLITPRRQFSIDHKNNI